MVSLYKFVLKYYLILPNIIHVEKVLVQNALIMQTVSIVG